MTDSARKHVQQKVQWLRLAIYLGGFILLFTVLAAVLMHKNGAQPQVLQSSALQQAKSKDSAYFSALQDELKPGYTSSPLIVERCVKGRQTNIVAQLFGSGSSDPFKLRCSLQIVHVVGYSKSPCEVYATFEGRPMSASSSHYFKSTQSCSLLNNSKNAALDYLEASPQANSGIMHIVLQPRETAKVAIPFSPPEVDCGDQANEELICTGSGSLPKISDIPEELRTISLVSSDYSFYQY